MSSKRVAIGLLGLAGALAAARATAGPGNINTSGAICEAYNAAHALEIGYLSNGVKNVGSVARQIACAVPRSVLPPGVFPTFQVHGRNDMNTCTSCTMTLHHYSGAMMAAQSFSVCPTLLSSLAWRQTLAFSINATDNYARLLCTLPARGAGIIHGITAVQ